MRNKLGWQAKALEMLSTQLCIVLTETETSPVALIPVDPPGTVPIHHERSERLLAPK